MPRVGQPAELTVVTCRWLGPHQYEFALSNGTKIVSRPVFVGWELDRPKYAVLNLGDGRDTLVPYRVPKDQQKRFDRQAADYYKQFEEDRKEEMASQFAEETKRRTEVWGWKDGKHAVPNITDGSAVCHGTTDAIMIKESPKAQPVTPSKKSKIVMPKRRKK